jgi:hypothetical protein
MELLSHRVARFALVAGGSLAFAGLLMFAASAPVLGLYLTALGGGIAGTLILVAYLIERRERRMERREAASGSIRL